MGNVQQHEPASVYQAYLEIRDDGRAMGHVLGLPGCFAKATSQDAAIGELSGAVEEYWSWLRRHGEKVPPTPVNPIIDVAEVVSSDAGFVSGDKVALFAPDREAPTDNEIEMYLQRMEYSRQDLLALVRQIPERITDGDPGGGRRTIRQTLQHVARAEWWYLSRIHLEPDFNLRPGDIFDAVRWTRSEAMARLRSFPADERSRVFIRNEFVSPWGTGELWTLRKVLRRFIEHEREHTKNIAVLFQELRGREDHPDGGSRGGAPQRSLSLRSVDGNLLPRR